MRACLVLCVAAAAFVCTVNADCDVCIDRQCYKKHSLATLRANGRCLGINRNSNTLYVDDTGYVLKCKLDTLRCNHTSKMEYFTSIVVDYTSGEMYGIAFTNKLYKLDLEHSRTNLLFNDNMWQIVISNGKLYYSKGYFGRGLYTFENGQSQVVAGTERDYNFYNFAISKDGDIYFDDSSHILKLSKGVVSRTNMDENTKITVDKDGDIIFIEPYSKGIYRLTNGEIVEIGAFKGDINTNFIPLFDRDNNIIIQYSNSRFHLKKEGDLRCSTSVVEDQTRIITETA